MNSSPYFVLLGIVVGWLLTQVAQWYKSRKEDNKLRKEVLFSLLELRNLIPRLNIDYLLDTLANEVLKRLPPESRTKVAKEEILKDLPVTPVVVLLKSLLNESFLEIEKHYHLSVQKLSSVDPLIAYSLAGQTNIVASAEKFIECINNIPVDGAEPGTVEFLKKTIASAVSQKALFSSHLFFEMQIKKLSRKIGLLTWIKAKKLISEMNYPIEFTYHDTLFLESILSQIMLSHPEGQFFIDDSRY